MFNKLYEKFIRFIKENWKALIGYVALFLIMTWPMPYYISTGGGTIDINDRIIIDNEFKSEGSFNFAYVSEIRATIPTYLISFLFPSWERIAISTVKLTVNETSKDVETRDKIYLSDANQNAVKLAYQAANKEFRILEENHVIVYLIENSKTDLKIGDIVLEVDGDTIPSIKALKEKVERSPIGSRLKFLVKRDAKDIICYLEVQEIDGKKIGGVSMLKEMKYETNPSLKLTFSKQESGPSGGLLLTLSIYDKLVDTDITKGRKIVGTGTIDQDGNVGAIGGVRYKLKGAVSSKADIFLVPFGENYDECIALQKKHNYNIKIIGVKTFQEAINALEKE